MRWFGILVCLLILTGCEDLQRIESHDPTLQYDRKTYEEKLTTPYPEKAVPYVPPKRGYKVPEALKTKVSLSVSEHVDLKDVLMELSRQGKFSIAISPSVTGGVFYQAQNKPAIEVLQDICHVAGLRYEVAHTTIRIEPDEPFVKTYNVQALSLIRKKTNRISTATDVFSAMEGHSREFDNGSSTLLTGDSELDFWKEMESNLTQITNGQGAYTLHKQAGLVTLTGTQAQHQQVLSFIQDVLYSTQLQVLIEAKIVEVNLDDKHQTGINWNVLKKDLVLQAPLGDLATPGPFDPTRLPVRNVFTVGAASTGLSALASVLSRFGTVRTLSSPRVTVMNNQTAVLKVATNQVFFKVNYYREAPINNQPSFERASSEIQTVPIGLVMVVHPSVDVETGRITLSLRPTISRIIGEVEDPAVGILSNNTRISKVPIVAVREMDSVLQLESGETVVMGGLMEDRSNDQRDGVPGFKNIPLLGNAFGGRLHDRNTAELAIFLKATVMQMPHVAEADKALYQNFTKDPRPLSFH